MTIQFAQWTPNGGKAGKHFTLTDKGAKKADQPNVYAGQVKNIDLEPTSAALVAYLENVGHAHAITAGTVAGDGGPFAPRAQDGDHHTRTLDGVSWPTGAGLLIIDVDCSEPIETVLEDLAAAGDRVGLDLSLAAGAWYQSGGSGFSTVDGSTDFGVTGHHVIYLIDRATMVPKVLQLLHRALWSLGKGWIKISSSGTMLERTYVDRALRSPNQLCYAAAPTFDAEKLKRADVGRHPLDGEELLDTGALHALEPDHERAATNALRAAKRESRGEADDIKSQWEATYRARLTGVSEPRVRAAMASCLAGKLLSCDVLTTRDGERVTVKELLDDPDDWDRQYFHDPVEPEAGGQRAIFFADTRQLLSHLHGRRWYDLERDEADAQQLTGQLKETALAASLADQIKATYRHTAGMGWLKQDGPVWRRDEDNSIWLAVRDHLDAKSRGADDPTVIRLGKFSTVTSVAKMAAAEPSVATPVAAWEGAPHLLNTPTGVVDLRTGDVRPHVDALFLHVTAVGPDDTPCPTWETFLQEVFEGNDDTISYVRRMLGYLVTGERREQQIYFGYGPGGSGKSTLADLLCWLLGSYAMVLPIQVLMQGKFQQHPTEIAQLQGVRLAVSSEPEITHKWAESRIKELTGDESARARRMRQDYFEFKLTHKHFVVGNYRPVMHGGDDAIARRMVLVPFDKSFQSAPDKRLQEKLRAEAPGIMRWLIAAAVDWYATGLVGGGQVKLATRSYVDTMDDFKEWMSECCTLGVNESDTSKNLLASFNRWKAERGERFMGAKVFGERLRKYPGIEEYRKSKARGYAGLSLTAEERLLVSATVTPLKPV